MTNRKYGLNHTMVRASVRVLLHVVKSNFSLFTIISKQSSCQSNIGIQISTKMADETSIIYPKIDEIDPQQAIFLYEKHCAILIIENLVPGSEIGFDLFADRVGEKFKGIKLIPPGIHFIYASAADKKSLQCGPRSGFFYDFKEREILIKKWSADEEDFDDTYKPTVDQLECYRANLRDLDRYLSAYKFSTYDDYLGLTSQLTPDSVESLQPECKRIRSVPYCVRQADTSNSSQDSHRFKVDSKVDEQSLLPDLKPDAKTVIHFSNLVDKQQPTLNPFEVTAYNLDTTRRLDHVFPGETGRKLLLQEFQFAFITFLLCHVYDCFEHWKRILSLICNADSGLSKYPDVYVKFIQALKQQLRHVPEDIFEDIVDSRNLIRTNLDIFFQNIDAIADSGSCRELKNIAMDLQSFIQEKFNWKFDIEPEDEQPIVVELA